MDTKLTIKQRLFAAKYVKNHGNGTQAALGVYNTKDPKVAHAIAAENIQKPAIKHAIEKALVKLDLTPEYALYGFKTLHESHLEENPNASVRALENIATIMNLYPSQKSLSMDNGNVKAISWLD